MALILTLKAFIEMIALFYMVCFTYSSLAYLRAVQSKGDRSGPVPQTDVLPSAAVLYFCCNDLNSESLNSLATLDYSGHLTLFVHDDSQDREENERVDSVCSEIKERSNRSLHVLRRPTHEGGKPGAVQYVLEQTHHLYEYFLLADNDSYVDSPDVLERAVSRFNRVEIAVVQCRNRTRQIDKDGPFAKALANSIDIFDVLMSSLFSLFWVPFIGHNAVLRTSAVMKVGGMAPGFFADDIDLSVRLHDNGFRILYCRDLELSESHPRNYRAFCLRTSKWATGCMQVLRKHTWRVLGSRQFSPFEKIGYFLFCGFYIFQTAIFFYLIVTVLLFPWLFPDSQAGHLVLILIGSIFPLAVFGPLTIFLWKYRRHQFWTAFAACAGTYGSTDFFVIQGLLKGLGGEYRWVPTNSVSGEGGMHYLWLSYLLGLVLLAVPLWYAPWMLLVPTTLLFCSKYLFVPAIASHYTEKHYPRHSSDRRRRLGAAAGGLSCLWALVLFFQVGFGNVPQTALADGSLLVEIRGDRFFIGEKEFIIRGIHYGPWRPGSGPQQDHTTSERDLRQDLELVRQANANTILSYDPSPQLLKMADEYGLKVIFALHVDWSQIPQGNLEKLLDGIEARVRQNHLSPALFAWMIGNEIPEWIISRSGPATVADAMRQLADRIRSIDPRHPMTHGNWPMTRDIGLDAPLDFVSFNLYPYFPPEVAAAGFGHYIERELKPIAGSRPLLISEFGINTLETTLEGQARTLRRCWQELREAGAAGGVVFEFADEWWKNYDNPIRPPNWWQRTTDPNDHLSHNEDPEEHYGIVTSDRNLKPAYNAVREMFSDISPSRFFDRISPVSLVASSLVVAVVGMSVFSIYFRRR